MDIPVVIGLEAGLSFLGIGIQPPTPSRGSMLNDGFVFIRNTPLLVIFAGLPIVVAILAFTFLGEVLRKLAIIYDLLLGGSDRATHTHSIAASRCSP